MTWSSSSQKLILSGINSNKKSKDLVSSKDSCKLIKTGSPNKLLITIWSMTQKRIRFCSQRSIIDWTTLKRNWSRMNLLFTQFSSTLSQKEWKPTINFNSKNAWLSAVKSIWISSKDVWLSIDSDYISQFILLS